MIENWRTCLAIIRKEEGGNDDDPHDPGGRTSRGIIQREYNAYRKIHNLLTGDVWYAPDAEIDDIYFTSYWKPYCPGFPAGVDLVFFDEHVNTGLHQAVLCLQRAVGVHDDGHIGIVTMEAVMRVKPKEIILGFSNARDAAYRKMGGFRRYGKGWIRRSHEVEMLALKMVS